MAPDDEDTQAFRAVDTQSHEVVEPATPPPAGPPPNVWLEDVWPWLALLGVLAVAGLLVWLFVFHNRHHAHRVVPAVAGLQQQAAISKLQADGYSVKAVIGAGRRPRGIVASQSPGGGSQLPKGATVTLHVSNGNAPTVPATTTTTTTTTATTAATTTAAAPTVQVPAVTNEDLVTAEGQVEAAGFVTEADPVDGGRPGTVTQQSPAPGGGAPAGSVVTIQVARGSASQAVPVPNVVGQSASDARAALAHAKLTFKTVYKPGKAGVVLAESPTGSQPVYAQIVVTVGR